MASSNFPGVPLGPPVDPQPATRPERRSFEGQYVRLFPVDVSQAPALYKQLCNPAKPSIFAYLPVGPFESEEQFTSHIRDISSTTDPLYYTVIPKYALSPGVAPDTPAGYLSLMNIDLAHRTIEIGSIILSPLLQRTTAATEALYLAMRYAMADLGNRRLEWKCDSLNAKSRRAADRLGFVYEGLFRNHRIVRARNRDTSWYSITDREWKDCSAAIEMWLSPENFKDGKQVASLQQLRQKLVGQIDGVLA
ncbi:gcn5-related n-acetyltransferase [Xylariomycetidae sp. FL2044]|nr:gcn5-related n-acetyltransferase [Xylariomycetidae sp. FL2044]